MKKFLNKTALLLMCIGVSASLQGQTIHDILSKMNLWQQKHPEEIVYLQCDRAQYAAGERLWFSARVIADIGERLLSRDLYAALVDPYGTVVTSARFRVSENRIKGDLDIPAETAPGRYILMAYTGWMQNAPATQVFTREVEIRKKEIPFSVQMKRLDGPTKPGSRVSTEISCISARNKPMQVPFRYTLTADGNTLVQGTGKTSADGKAILQVTLPSGTVPVDTRLQAVVSAEGITAGTTLVIPTGENMLQVAFYPEGGTLVAGVRRKIAFRAFNAFGKPVQIEGEIHDNTGPAGVVATGEDGLGTFLLTPGEEQSYWLKVTSPAGIDEPFPLPDPLRSGVVLSLVSHTPESLGLRFEQVNRRIQTYHFIAQMKGRVYWMESHRVNLDVDLTVPLADFPAGIAEVAVFDSALTPVASRLIFVNPSKRLFLEIIPDKPAYGPREQIGLTIKTLDETGKPVQAEVSLAVVVPAGAGLTDDRGIFTHTALLSDLAGYVPLPAGWTGQGTAETSRLDDLLITAKFSRFNWAGMLRIHDGVPADTYPDSTGNTGWLNFNLAAAVMAKNKLAFHTVPGIPFTLQPQNDPATWGSAGTAAAPANLYGGRLSVPEIIYQIRPYTLKGGKIYFDNSSISSISYQDGAIIAIDGKLMGTDVSILNGILPVDIDHINVSTRSADIQKYTSLNSVGVIEVYTKVNDRYKAKVEDIKPVPGRDLRKPSVFDARTAKKPAYKGAPVTLYWQPAVTTDAQGLARVEFVNTKEAAALSIRAEGITGTGLAGSQVLILSPR